LAASLAVGFAKFWIPMFLDALEIVGFEVSSQNLPGFGKDGNSNLGLALTVFACLIVLAIVSGLLPANLFLWLSFETGSEVLKFFMVVVAIIVVAVPEGLPMSITLSLAYGMRKMMAQNILIKNLNASETVGATTVICSDKTGTLTLNKMCVSETHFPFLNRSNSSFENMATGDFSKDLSDGAPTDFWKRLVLEGIAANSTAHLCQKKGEGSASIGNPTEGALLVWMNSLGWDYCSLRSDFRIERQWTFSADRKFMATFGSSPILEKDVLYVKGAPEIVLAKCKKILTEKGILELRAEREKIEKLLESLQARGMRTLGFAFREGSLPSKTFLSASRTIDLEASSEGLANLDEVDELPDDLIWLGSISISDPVRPEVVQAIEICQNAGVEVKMVTGDNPLTASEIARQIGLISGRESYFEHLRGEEFRNLSEKESIARVGSLKILSRAKPMDKLRLVECLKKRGEIVAVTGDGINDGPALNAANVGLAMGKTGSDLAKQAGDIILLDDSFSSIVTAISWGRALYLNIQRFLVFQLTINFVALSVAFLGPLVGVNLPFTVIQMLWVNLIMDTFAALAFATEPPNEALMRIPPRRNDDFILTPEMLRTIFLFGTISILIFVLMFFMMNRSEPFSLYHLTVFFAVFVLMQFWNMFNVRRFGLPSTASISLSENYCFVAIALVILLGQFLIVQFGGNAFRTVPLELRDWLIIIVATSPVVLIGNWRTIWNFCSPK